MNIEELNKSQIVLLTLLVSFVTSIATGIVTVSLMDQAPPIVAQTVNRIVEHTIETVVPAASGQAAATVVTQEKTVIVHESEQISKAIEKVSPSLVRLYTSFAEDASFLGIGIVMDASGMIVADSGILGDGSEAFASLPDGTRLRANVTARNSSVGLVFLAATTTGEKKIEWVPAKFSADNPTLGESVIALSGKSTNRVAQGIVTALVKSGGTIIDTDISTGSILSGSPLVNLDGTIIGISTLPSREVSPTGFVPSRLLLTDTE